MSHISALLGSAPTLSFEFFPPRDDEGQRALEKTLSELDQLEPSFVSVTYGAGGSVFDRTREIVLDIQRGHRFPAMPHLTCVGHSRADLVALLDDYAANGIDNILALAGDPPADGSDPGGDFRYACELVDLIRDHPHSFSIGVAAFPEVHPRSANRADDRRRLAAKLERADFAITQFFFDATDYFGLIDELAELGCRTPVLPGVLPPANPVSARRFAVMNGAKVPEDLFARLEAADVADRDRIAVDAASDLTAALLEGGVPGVHFYSLNRSHLVVPVIEAVGLRG